MADEDRHTFAYRFSHGQPGRDGDPANVLCRSLHFLLEEGHPQRAVTLCMMGDVETAPEEPIRWFGVFVLSEGRRVLYFPGFFQPKGRVVALSGRSQMADRPFRVDHLTLEPDLASWHLTEGPSRRRHQSGPNTKELGKGRVLWCGMSVAKGTVFREVYRETLVAASVPGSDAERRSENFQEAALADEDQLIPPPPSNTFSGQPEFLHFALIAGPEGFPVVKGQHFMTPHNSPWVEPRLPDPLTGVYLRSHRLPIGEGLEVEIAATRLPGRLTVPVSFTSA